MYLRRSSGVAAGVIMAAVGLAERYEAEVHCAVHYVAVGLCWSRSRLAPDYSGVSAGKYERKRERWMDV